MSNSINWIHVTNNKYKLGKVDMRKILGTWLMDSFMTKLIYETENVLNVMLKFNGA